jgi:NADPH2:quinone reductase
MTMNRFEAFRIHQDDGKVNGRFEKITVDDLTPGQVVIDVQYSSINYKDALAATGAVLDELLLTTT